MYPISSSKKNSPIAHQNYFSGIIIISYTKKAELVEKFKLTMVLTIITTSMLILIHFQPTKK